MMATDSNRSATSAEGTGGGPLRALFDVRPGEWAPLVVSLLYFYFSLASYFILRPIRDEMAVAGGTRELPWLFAGTLAANLLLNPIYGGLVSRFPRRKFVVITYAFFALNLVVLYGLWRAQWHPVGVGRTFYIWTTAYVLFVTSVFWGVMADSFYSSQAKRLFGLIAVGGTLGSISGSAITAFTVERVGVANLMLVSATFLALAAGLVAKFPRVPVPPEDAHHPEVDRDRTAIGGTAWAGMAHVMKSPYLAGIAGFILLYTLGSTVLYFAQTDIIGQHYSDREQRTAILAKMELVTQSIAGVGQLVFTSFAMRTFGLSVTLAAVPFVSLIGFVALGAAGAGMLPLLATFMVLNVARRSTEYMLTNPSRKVLFTVLSREDKYKATSFIETFVYRLGDQLASWGYAGAVAVGLTLGGISWIAAAASGAFVALAVWLGRRQRELANRPVAVGGPTPVAPPPVAVQSR